MRAQPIKTVALTLMACAAGSLAAPAMAQAGSPDKCAAFASQALGEGVQITSATHVAATARSFVDPNGWPVAALPAHCKVEGLVNARKGAGGKDYGIHFAIALPDDWSGRFLLQGGGGLNGMVLPPTGPVASDGRPALARGFAVISSDSGHKGMVFDASFMADQRATLDFAEASVRTVALLGKQIVKTYYGKAIDHSYMTGCSTGGRETMLATQRYPELFDGVIIGAPAMRTGDSNLAIEYTQVLLNRIAPKGADGKPNIAALLDPKVRTTILDGVLGQCDGLDGLKDGMIENVAQCKFDPKKLICKPGQTDSCLSGDLAAALETAFAGPKDKSGYALYTPVPFDTGIVDMRGGYLPTGAPGPLGPASAATSIDLDARIHAIRQDAGQRLTDTNYWTNLNTYLDRGGKMIFFHGVSDFWFSPLASWDYYQRAEKTNGKAFTDASRFYMVPGMQHCQGGNSFDQFDMLSKIVDWVEKGEAPGAITAHRSAAAGPGAPANPERAKEARPLCPFPAHAQYIGGDAKVAASFSCQPPKN